VTVQRTHVPVHFNTNIAVSD